MPIFVTVITLIDSLLYVCALNFFSSQYPFFIKVVTVLLTLMVKGIRPLRRVIPDQILCAQFLHPEITFLKFS